MNIVLGILIICVGLTLVMKTEGWLSFFGRIGFFENWFGVYGGSRLGYKLLGVLVIFIGTLVLTGMISGFMMWILSPLLFLK